MSGMRAERLTQAREIAESGGPREDLVGLLRETLVDRDRLASRLEALLQGPGWQRRGRHQRAAEEARERPGEWVLVAVYGSSQSAWSARGHIIRRKWPTFPPDRYETYVTGELLWARYTGGEVR